jgi:transposase
LRAALDSSPLWGAGQVEDTYNLLGHALRKAVGVIARQQGRGLRAVAEEAGASLVAVPSLKVALDLDWDDATAQQHALTMILDALHAVEHWLNAQPAQEETTSRAGASLAVAQQVCAPDLTTTPDGTPTLRQGVAEDRRISSVKRGPYDLDWERHELRCPGGETMPFEPGGVVKSPAATCAQCPLWSRCTTSTSGRSISIHPDEAPL